MRTFKNTILSHLDSEIIERLSLQTVTFELRHEIEYPGNPITHLYFVEEGMASMTATFNDGSQVEVGMFGYASIIGVPALMGAKRKASTASIRKSRAAVCSVLLNLRGKNSVGVRLFKRGCCATYRPNSHKRLSRRVAMQSTTWNSALPGGYCSARIERAPTGLSCHTNSSPIC